jgi:antitoxin YefM
VRGEQETGDQGLGNQEEKVAEAPLTSLSNCCTVFLYRMEKIMTLHTNYTQARAGFAKLLDKVTRDREVVVIQRRGAEDVALISANELSSLTETAYLLRSPKNAERLLAALGRALKNEGQPLTADELRREVGLESEKA